MAEADNLFLYLVGTAGSGKTRLAAGMQRWMQEHSLDAIVVNLDPGAEQLPYVPDVDIRDWVRVQDIMEKHGLGPNGAQIAAADILALQSDQVAEAIATFRSDLVVLDTPGQTELFVFREAGRHIVEDLAPGRSAVAFLIDPFLARNPAAFVGQAMLAATTQFRFQVPLVSLLTKVDMLEPEEVERLQHWLAEPDALLDALGKEDPSMHTHMHTSLFRVLEELGAVTQLLPVSGETLDGIDDVVAFLQNAFAGAEDLTTR